MVMTNDNVAAMEPPAVQNGRKPSSPPAPAAPPAFLTIDEVAAVLRVSVRSVYRLVEIGRIMPPTRFGALLRWSTAAFNAWIANGSPPFRLAGKAARR